MSHQDYHEWFLVHSGKKPQSFLSGLKSKIDSTISESLKKEPPKEKPKEKRKKVKPTTKDGSTVIVIIIMSQI